MKDKHQALDKLRKKMLKADLPLKKTALSLVFGAGSLDPDVFFIGEAPGANEDKQGLPFIGSAGKNLERLLQSIGLTRDSVYITSIIKYRPPKNRQPTFLEIKEHTPFLIDQIRIIQPRLIVSLGNFATRFMLSMGDITQMGRVPGITQLHGKAQNLRFEDMSLTVMPVFHPAALLYNPALKKSLEEDFQRIVPLLKTI